MKRFLLLWMTLILTTALWAYDFQSGDLYYNITNSTVPYTVEVTSSPDNYKGLTSVIIPNTVTNDGKTYSVTSIGERAFYYCTGLISVTIPDSVMWIGGIAFGKCTSLTSVSIPNSVAIIENDAFSGCMGLTSITIPNSVVYIGEGAFSNVPNIVYDGTAIGSPWGARSVNGYVDGYLVYKDATKTTLLACSSVATGAITIPNSVTSIGSSAFVDCTGLTSIVVESGNTVYDSRENCNAIIETATNTLIKGCNTSIIPNSVTSIEESAFWGCIGLTSITIPNSVTSIGNYAFSSCTGLTSVTIGNSVTSIGGRAFFSCTGLASIVIESGNTVYDSRENCNAIIKTATNTLIKGCNTTVIPNSVAIIGYDAFYGCTGLTFITIPNSVTSIGDYAFCGCTGLTSVTIPNSVTSIGVLAFCGCTGLTSVTIGNSVMRIGNAFWGCAGLTSIVVESGNTVYDSRDNCNAIIDTETNTLIRGCNTTVIPNSVTSIGSGAFYVCTGLTSVTIPNSVTSIGSGAFYGCTGLTSVTIPNSVMSIGSSAFSGCTGLTSVTVLATTPPTIGQSTFSGVSTDIPVYIPCGTTDAYQAADGWSSFMNYIEIPPYILTVTAQDETKGTVRTTKEATCADNTAVIEATANEGYKFLQWSDGNTDNPRTITVDEDITLTAEFTSTPTAIGNTSVNTDATRKVFVDGQVRILRNGKTYTVTGQEVK